MEIKKNENSFDRFVKVLVGTILLFLAIYFFPGITFPLNFVVLALLLFASLWCIVTGLIGYCPLYALLGINTIK